MAGEKGLHSAQCGSRLSRVTAVLISRELHFLACADLGDILEHTCRDVACPCLRALKPESVSGDCRNVARLGILNGAVSDGLAGDAEEDISFLIRVAAVSLPDTAVIGGDDKQSVVKKAFQPQLIVNPADIGVQVADGLKLGGRAESFLLADHIGRSEMDKKHHRRVVGKILNRHTGYLRIDVLGLPHLNADIVLYDAVVDGVPAHKGGKLRFRTGLPRHPEDGRIRAEHRILEFFVFSDGVGHTVILRKDSVQQRAPALRADGRVGGLGPQRGGLALEDFVEARGRRVVEERTGAVDADYDNVLVCTVGQCRVSPFAGDISTVAPVVDFAAQDYLDTVFIHFYANLVLHPGGKGCGSQILAQNFIAHSHLNRKSSRLGDNDQAIFRVRNLECLNARRFNIGRAYLEVFTYRRRGDRPAD